MDMTEAGGNQLLSERRRANVKSELVRRLEKERDDAEFRIPDGAKVITLKSWSKDHCEIDTQSFARWLGEDRFGLIAPVALPSHEIIRRVRKFKDTMRSDSRLYTRVHAIAKRTSIRNPNRPQSSSPVKGFGLARFGPELDLNKRSIQDQVLSNSLSAEHETTLDTRLQKEMQYIREVDKVRQSCAAGSSDPVVVFLDGAEEHQVLTGGGYDNTYVGQARVVSYDWLNKEVKPIENTPHSEMAMRYIHYVQEQYRAVGIAPESLDLVDYHIVRDASNTDGTIGLPVLLHGNDIFTVDLANSIRDFYGVDMRAYVGAYVKTANYTGPVRVKDALNDLPFLMPSISDQMMNMLTVQLSRTQRKGYSKLDEPKKGKFRSIKMPEALHAIMSGAIATAFKLKSADGVTIPLLSGQLPPQQQEDIIGSEIAEMYEKGFTGFPLDESAFDASLLASVMATIILKVYMPLFKKKYWPVFYAVAFGFCNKLVVTPTLEEEDRYFQSHNMVPPTTPKNTYLVKDFAITYVQDKLLSGDYLTQHLGSNYNYWIVQLMTYAQLGYIDTVPMLKGFALGDDVAMYIPLELVDKIGMDKVLALIQAALANYSIDANASKQYVFRHDPSGQYLVVFLQKYYLPALNIKGIGSPARSVAGAPFSEYSPLSSKPPMNMALQEIGIISVMNNGHNYPEVDKYIRFLFEQDSDLLSIFQVYGSSSFQVLTKAAGGETIVKEALSHLAYSPASGVASVIEGVALPIIDKMVAVAKQMGHASGDALPAWLTQGTEPSFTAEEESSDVSD